MFVLKVAEKQHISINHWIWGYPIFRLRWEIETSGRCENHESLTLGIGSIGRTCPFLGHGAYQFFDSQNLFINPLICWTKPKIILLVICHNISPFYIFLSHPMVGEMSPHSGWNFQIPNFCWIQLFPGMEILKKKKNGKTSTISTEVHHSCREHPPFWKRCAKGHNGRPQRLFLFQRLKSLQVAFAAKVAICWAVDWRPHGNAFEEPSVGWEKARSLGKDWCKTNGCKVDPGFCNKSQVE